MKLCLKCFNDIKYKATELMILRSGETQLVATESDCEFWAHKELNDERRKNPFGQWSDPTARGVSQ